MDHYVAISKYPFAGANLRNLVPMGGKCNQKFKKEEDILRRQDGMRRRAFDPYGSLPDVRVSLTGSTILGDGRGNPQWEISFLPDLEEVQTWVSVFELRERYERDVLTPHYRSWIRDFASWCAMPSEARRVSAKADAMRHIEDYIGLLEVMNEKGPQFLRVPYFRELYVECEQEHDGVVPFLQTYVNPLVDRVCAK